MAHDEYTIILVGDIIDIMYHMNGYELTEEIIMRID